MEQRLGGEIPEEVKNQIVDGKKRVETVDIPKTFLDDIEKENKKQSQLSQQFYMYSRQFVQLQELLQDLNTRMKDSEEAKKRIYEHAFKKLRLGKDANRRWQIKGNSFVGVLNIPPKPAPESNNKEVK